MIAALLVLALVTVGVGALTYVWDRDMALPARLSVGVTAGTAALGLIGYPLALALGLTPLTVWLSALLLLIPLAVFASPEIRKRFGQEARQLRPRLRSGGHRAYYLAYLFGAVVLVGFLWGAMYEREGGIWTTNHYNHGDLPWHLGIIQGFTVGKNFPPQHPEYAGTRLTYPFLVDFITAQLVVAGATVTDAVRLQNVVLALSFLTLAHVFALRVTRSRFAFLVVPALLYFSGGWGWLILFKNPSGLPLWNLFLHPPVDVTRNDAEAMKWGNLLTVLLGTQRGFLMALPLALAVFLLLWQGFRRDDSERLPRMAGAGFLAGLTPLVHGHTFLTLILTGATLACFDIPHAKSRWRGWLAYFGIAGILAVPQVFTLAADSAVHKGAFFGFLLGWDSETKDFFSWLIFWYRNTGPLLPLLALALVWWGRVPAGTQRGWAGWRPLSGKLKAYFLPFALCFVLGNVTRLAPWPWDNIKVLFYFAIGAALLVAALLSVFWRRGPAGKVISAFLLVLLTLAGALDVWRMASGSTAAAVYEADAVSFARLIEEKTPPDARILTAPTHNNPPLLAGRRALCGFNGHLWSHGLDYDARQEEVRRIYAGDPDADALLRKLQVAYIIVSPAERSESSFQLNDAYLSRFPVVGAVGPYRLLAVLH